MVLAASAVASVEACCGVKDVETTSVEMTMEIVPIHDEIGADVFGLDLGRTLSDTDFEAVDRAINQYSVLVFRDQVLDDDTHIAFSKRFGPLEEEHVAYYSYGRIAYVGQIGNVDAAGRQLENENRRVRSQTANNMWHSDSSFREIPSLYSLLYAYEVPSIGGDTEFVSARAAYRRLDKDTRETIDPLIGVHDYIYSRVKVGADAVNEGQRAFMRPVRQRLVRMNPVTGEKNYYVGSHVRSIVGWTDDDARALIERLIEWATRPQSIYRHQWRAGDLVMWDNRCVLHRGCGYDANRYRRRLHQTRVRGVSTSLAEVH